MEQIESKTLVKLKLIDDYKKLKYYRHIRNKIVHENGANEKNMCNKDDVKWIESFYNKVKKSEDPLTIYYTKARKLKNKNRKPHKKHKVNKTVYIFKLVVLLALFLLIIYLIWQIFNIALTL